VEYITHGVWCEQQVTLIGKCKRNKRRYGGQDNLGKDLESSDSVRNVFGVAGLGSAGWCWEHRRGTGIGERNDCLSRGAAVSFSTTHRPSGLS